MVPGKYTDVFRGIFLVWEGDLRWGCCVGGSFHGKKLIIGEETFNEVGAKFSSAIKKNNKKINMKIFFLQKVRSSIKT